MALNSATEHYNVYVEQQKDKFDSTYRSKCIETAPPEIFTVRAQVAEYHYTLYYYDQAGNLVRTVPPQGVDISRLEESRIEGWHDSVNLARTAGTHRVPDHSLATNYRYNSLNQVVAQKSPDGGLSKFWYDALGRLVVSQNAKQETTDKYSYTKFDQLGRITEVGQLTSATAIAQNISQDPEDLETWIGSVSNSREQITTTFYDISAGICSPALLCQANLRNRVSYTTLRDLATDADYATASFFSYDIHGNVDTLLNHYFKGVLHDVTGNAFKKMVWKYDLISGKVNELAYQPGYKDEFYHRYNYDAQNRLTTVYTSHDYVYWERQASYEYYKHGPLSRTVLGQLGVQGLDYAYTLQGWLKGVNSTSVTTDYDMGRDAEYTSPIARDAYGFSLNYHANDYIPVRQSQIYLPFASVPFGLTALGDGVQTGRALFNGNIASMTVNIPRLGEAQVYGYSYDQLNRIRAMNAYTGLDTMTNTFTAVTSENYKERVNYDANGNILHYLRNGKEITSTSPLGMDDMVYHYKPGTNQLDHVYDNPSLSSNYPNTPHPTTKDIDDQPLANYEYDEIGNMIKDSTEGISKNGIVWNVYGKIASVTKTEGAVTTIITYTYDPSGNRIGKKVQKTGQTDKYTAYVRDASGNVMAIYEKGNSEINDGQLTQTEISLYGSSRLGVWRPDRDVEGTDWWLFETSAMTGTSNGLRTETWTRGKVNFELSNHLGNVLATITDRKLYDGKFLGRICTLLAGCRDVETDDPYELVELGVNEYPLDNPVFWYPVMKADIVTANDYYPFGMQMPGRTFADENAYRYGFNGKENDNELKRDGNSLDFGARIYDSRLGIFLSTDPREEEYPNQSPYVFAANNPIYLIDVNGEGPGVPPGTVLYANHPYSGAAGILSEGFNAAKYSESGWNWLMTNPDGNSIGKKQANHPVQFKVEVDMSKAKKISHSQWTKWYDEALKELKLSRSATLTEEQVGAATKIRNRIAAEWMTKDGGQLYEITARQGAPTGSGQRIIAARDQVLQNAKPIVVRGSASRLMWESFRRLFTTKVGVKSLGKAGGGILLEIGVLYALEKKHEANRYYAKTQKWSAYNDVGLLYYTPFFDWWDNLKIAPSSVQPDPEAYEKYNKQYGTNFTKAQFNSMRSMAMSAGY
jgi:RHS repeat-associated protein